MTDLLDGVSERSKKGTIWARLQQADEQLESMQTIAKTRRKWNALNPEHQHSVIVTASEQDWMQSLEFLHDLQDVLPPALLRLLHGGRTMLASHLEEDEDQIEEVESPQN